MPTRLIFLTLYIVYHGLLSFDPIFEAQPSSPSDEELNFKDEMRNNLVLQREMCHRANYAISNKIDNFYIYLNYKQTLYIRLININILCLFIL